MLFLNACPCIAVMPACSKLLRLLLLRYFQWPSFSSPPPYKFPPKQRILRHHLMNVYLTCRDLPFAGFLNYATQHDYDQQIKARAFPEETSRERLSVLGICWTRVCCPRSDEVVGPVLYGNGCRSLCQVVRNFLRVSVTDRNTTGRHNLIAIQCHHLGNQPDSHPSPEAGMGSSASNAALRSIWRKSCRRRLALLSESRDHHRFWKRILSSCWYWRILRYTSPSLGFRWNILQRAQSAALCWYLGRRKCQLWQEKDTWEVNQDSRQQSTTDRLVGEVSSKAGYWKLIVLSGTPMIGSGPAVHPGSINMITNDDYVSPPMSCVHFERKEENQACTVMNQSRTCIPVVGA